MPLPPSVLAALAVLACAVLLGLLSACQGRLLFGRARRIRRAPPGPAAAARTAQAVVLERPGGIVLRGWVSRATGQAPRRLLLWFGGRNEHVAWTPALAGWLPDDVALVAFNYRGLGGSGGRPSQAACVADAEAIAGWACARFGLGPPALHLAGRSLGSGIAMQLAARLPGGPAGLVLLTPPQSIRALLRARPLLAPLAPLLRSPLDSCAAARALRCPVLMLLAEQDHRVPHAHSLALAAALRRAGAAVELRTLAGTCHRSLARSPAAMALMGRALAAPADRGLCEASPA